MKPFLICRVFLSPSSTNLISLKNRQFVLTLHRKLCNETHSLQEITIKTCGSLYEKWRYQGKFSKLPNTDLTFRVSFIDTNKNQRNNIPVVLALHGAPGSCKDFSYLINYFHRKDVRVIAPTFPNFSDLRPGIFRHSDEERANFIKDFLSAISVSQIDLLICHSSAIYPGLLLCLEQNSVVKSLAMLNPGSFQSGMPALPWLNFIRTLVKASENKMMLKVMKMIWPFAVKIVKIPVRSENPLDVLLSATVMINTNISQSKEKFHQLSSSGFPMFYAFSEDDKLIGKENVYELAYLLGAKPIDISYIDKNGIVKRQGEEKSNLTCMAFENGSHYVFWKYADIINQAILKFLLKHKS